MEGYYEEGTLLIWVFLIVSLKHLLVRFRFRLKSFFILGGGDKDARDLLDMRRSERFQKGIDGESIFRKRRQRSVSPPESGGKIGKFEKFTKGFGRKFMEQQGWTDGAGLGPSSKGIADALESDGQGPRDRRGLGFYGENLKLGSCKTKPNKLSDYSIVNHKSYIIGTVYDKTSDLEHPEPLLRQNYPTFVKRYGSKLDSHFFTNDRKYK